LNLEPGNWNLEPGTWNLENWSPVRDFAMKDALKILQPWVVFGGCALVVVVLYWAQAVLLPFTVALLLSFVLAPVVAVLERWVGRAVAVLSVTLLVFSILGGVGWIFTRQLASVAAELPSYRQNIRTKISDIRGFGKGGAVEQLQSTVESLNAELAVGEPARNTRARPVFVEPQQSTGLWGYSNWIGSMLGGLATAGLVVALVIFMLLERGDLRDRLIGLTGHGNLPRATKAFDEAASRVSRYLLMQSLVNLTYGVGVGVGLYAIGVPYPLLWASLAAVLRFIPYLGPWIGAGAPLVVSLAALPGWIPALWVAGLFTVLELFTNLVLETFLYAGAAGVSQVAQLAAVAFWAWLWGPLGLLLATPLTVCLVVLGKNVPGLAFVATLMAEAATLPSDVRYYQRLLARDESEASDLLEQYVKTNSPESVYDMLLLPALNYAERDRMEERLSSEEEAGVVSITNDLVTDAALMTARVSEEENGERDGEQDREQEEAAIVNEVQVLGYPVNSPADEAALHMLAQVLDTTPVKLDIVSGRMMVSEVVATVQQRGCGIVCIGDLPPSPSSKTRYIVKKLRQALPDLKIVVGRWAPPSLADESPRPLLDAGAHYVGSSLLETRDQLRELAQRMPRSVSANVA
jgi:predicted PurR-regulated permease PerM